MNNVELVGRLVRDPVMTNGGKAMITLAIKRPTKDDASDFPSVSVFGEQAKNVCKYLKKGRWASVQGHIQTGKYDRNGETIYYTEVIANRIEFISDRQKDAENEQKQSSDEFEELDDCEVF